MIINEQHISSYTELEMGMGKCLFCGKQVPVDRYDDCPACGQDLIIAYRTKCIDKVDEPKNEQP